VILGTPPSGSAPTIRDKVSAGRDLPSHGPSPNDVTKASRTVPSCLVETCHRGQTRVNGLQRPIHRKNARALLAFGPWPGPDPARPDAKRRNESVTNCPQLSDPAPSRGQTRVNRLQRFVHRPRRTLAGLRITDAL
jgi:hypothetical protein